MRILGVLLAAFALALGAAFVAGAGVARGSSSHGAGIAVTFTVKNMFDGSGERVLSSTLPGCASAMVVTLHPRARFVDGVWKFSGRKTFYCGAAGTFELVYAAFRVDGAPKASGTWTVTGGTGTYADMSGGGTIRGVYLFGDNPPESPIGIVDTYRGVVRR